MCLIHKWGDWVADKLLSRMSDSWDVTVEVWEKRICTKCKKPQHKFIKQYFEK